VPVTGIIANVLNWASADKAVAPVILVYRIGIDCEASGVVTIPRRLPQPFRRRLRSGRRTINADQLGVVAVLIVRADVVQDISGFHGRSLRADPDGR